MRRVDVGARTTADWCVTSLLAALDGGRLDGSASYATINLRRHIEERIDATRRGLEEGDPRLQHRRHDVVVELTALSGLVTRFEDAVGKIIADDGEPGEVERIVLRQMVRAVSERLAAVHQAEIDVSMLEHWTDIGGSG